MKANNYTFLLSICSVAALGGFLFGFDWVVIGGAKPFYELFFKISDSPGLKGWAMSSALIGCVGGAIIAGAFSDRYGRKKLLIAAAVLFIISAYGSGIASDFSIFILYRIIGGLGIGIASTLSPMYIAEVTPAKIRGMFVSINQLTIVVGILAAQVSNMLIAEKIPDLATNQEILSSWNGQHGWRWMFWAELIPAFLFFFFMFLVPESPRFLIKAGQKKKGTKILSKIGGAAYADKALISIENSLSIDDSKVSNQLLTDKRFLSILILGVVLASFQQWCGINIIFNYAQEIFQSAGYSINDMFFNIVLTGSVNLAFTIVAMLFVDKLGRKKLMLFGAGGLTIIYIILGWFYYIDFNGWPMLVLVITAIAVFAVSLAPVTWVVLSEIFPNKIRGKAMSIATLSLWVSSSLLVLTFPYLNETLNTSGTFWVYSGICLMGFIFILKKLPETKNKSLEELEEVLMQEK
ncbi:sugar porter family MFS transporter [Reichenbachiella ulvae]|uniref:Sugar porter family MFS transporter n=1 Tax=Reichenbachiella ulvae TaxID=2980104 RepID=A0ABT3CUG7_9BACT|nr:sugar porter family MFS transporter [Reichenbachiella ulvae]MCV9387340.1 sugar porter family MFS transporter [Reichenbachiella ulvae]